MAWYEIMLLVSLALFLITTVGSMLFGGADLDFDVETGTLLSDIISFKGLLHFCIGFSLVLTLMKEVTLLSVAGGVATGLVFAAALYFLYKFFYGKAQKSISYTTEINDMEAEVYFWDKTQRIGEVFLTLEGRPVTVTITCPEGVDLKNGHKIKVSGTRSLVYPTMFEKIMIKNNNEEEL